MRSLSDAQSQYSWASSTSAGGFLVYESFSCRPRRIHEFDAAGTLVATDSTEIPPFPVYSAPGGFYYYRTPAGGAPLQLVWWGPRGEERVVLEGAPVGALSALEGGGLLIAGSTWTRLDPNGRVLWSTPSPGRGYRAYAATADGGVYAVGCVSHRDYCGAGPETRRVFVRLGPDGGLRWQLALPWDGVAAWSLLGVRELPDGGAIAVGGVTEWLYADTPSSYHAITALRVDAAGGVVWDRTYPGWGAALETAGSVVEMSALGDRVSILLTWHTPLPATSRWRYVGLTLSTGGSLVGQSLYDSEVNGTLVRLARGGWGRGAYVNNFQCGRYTCSGEAGLRADVLR